MVGNQCLDVAKDLDGDVGVFFDRLEDLDVLYLSLFRLLSSVLECEPVLLRLAVAGKEQHRSGVRRPQLKKAVQKDETLGVERAGHVCASPPPGEDRRRLGAQRNSR